jgi:hypothetical protein
MCEEGQGGCFGADEVARQRINAHLDEASHRAVGPESLEDGLAVGARRSDVEAQHDVTTERSAQETGEIVSGGSPLDPDPMWQHVG